MNNTYNRYAEDAAVKVIQAKANAKGFTSIGALSTACAIQGVSFERFSSLDAYCQSNSLYTEA